MTAAEAATELSFYAYPEGGCTTVAAYPYAERDDSKEKYSRYSQTDYFEDSR
jgi:hypothetical protein